MEKGYGTSEEIIGDWLRSSGKRNHIMFATAGTRRRSAVLRLVT